MTSNCMVWNSQYSVCSYHQTKIKSICKNSFDFWKIWNTIKTFLTYTHETPLKKLWTVNNLSIPKSPANCSSGGRNIARSKTFAKYSYPSVQSSLFDGTQTCFHVSSTQWMSWVDMGDLAINSGHMSLVLCIIGRREHTGRETVYVHRLVHYNWYIFFTAMSNSRDEMQCTKYNMF